MYDCGLSRSNYENIVRCSTARLNLMKTLSNQFGNI